MNFNEWKQRELHKGNFFITDGIIDKQRWESSKVKILYILKEAYVSDPRETQEWDLCNHLTKGLTELKKKMWWTLSQWSYGINKLVETNEILQFNEGFKNDDDFNEAFLSSAIINIKKSAGKRTSKKSDLSLYVENDWDLISKQIEEINPDLIVCGATWPIIEKHLKAQDFLDFEKCACSEWLYQRDKYYFVDFWHPANQYPNKLNYYSLLTALKFSVNKWSKVPC